MTTLSIAVRFLSALILVAHPVAAQLGRIEFPTSAQAPEAQAAFLEGVLLLHSFEYEDARDSFQAAKKIEPGFAMATWGEVMTYQQPIWRREQVEKARAALAELGATPAERRDRAGTEVERHWIGAAEALFGSGTRQERWTAHRDALAAMHAQYPHDVEVGAFYALSILAANFGQRDERVYMQGAAVAQRFYRREPDHPGLLHYLIHSYDDSTHAPLGLEMAQRYDKVAPAAGHALHMPSHIYVALGMWAESNRANEASFAAGEARRERKQLGVGSGNWHALRWLAYGYLQRGRQADALQQLQVLAEAHGREASRGIRNYLVYTRAAHLVETHALPPQLLQIEVDFENASTSLVAIDHFTHAMAALLDGDVASATRRLAAVRELAPVAADLLPPGATATCAAGGYRPETLDDQLAARVVAKQIEAAIARVEGDDAAAVAALEAACRDEDRMDPDFGPPRIVKPAHEMFGQLLLALDRPADAVAQFELALRRAPLRARSLLGLSRAHAAAGNPTAAKAVAQKLAAIWHVADADVPGLAEIRALADVAGGAGVTPASSQR